MNVLLFAPGFLLLLLEQQSVWRALVNVTSIAIVQVCALLNLILILMITLKNDGLQKEINIFFAICSTLFD